MIIKAKSKRIIEMRLAGVAWVAIARVEGLTVEEVQKVCGQPRAPSKKVLQQLGQKRTRAMAEAKAMLLNMPGLDAKDKKVLAYAMKRQKIIEMRSRGESWDAIAQAIEASSFIARRIFAQPLCNSRGEAARLVHRLNGDAEAVMT